MERHDSTNETGGDKALAMNDIPTAQEDDYTPTRLIRYPHTQTEVDLLYKTQESAPIPWSRRVKSKCTCSAKDVSKYALSLFPLISICRTYKLQSLLGDVVSGVSAACLHFPQGLAFGLLASLSPSYGLYTSFFPVVFYIIFGTSQHLSVGTNAVIALFTSELVRSNVQLPIPSPAVNETNTSSSHDTSLDSDFLIEKASVASGSAFIVGVFLLLLGVARLGFVTSYLSSSFVGAFTTTAAIHIITSQVPKALGMKIHPITGAGKLVLMYIEIFKAIPKANVCSVITSLVCVIILVLFKDIINERYKQKMKMPVPIDLILVILATVVSHFTSLHDNFAISVVGDIPVGIPSPAFPTIRTGVIGNSIVVAIVIFVLNISMVRICEVKHGYQVSNDQELIAYGATNFISSFFWCFPSCTAPPRTVILSSMGAKTTINAVFTAIILLLILLLIGQYFTSLPIPVLSIMVIIAVKNLLVQLKQLPTLWRINKYDLVIWLGTFLSGVLIDLPFAIYIGVALCLLTVVIQSQNGRSYVLSKTTKEDLFLDTSTYSDLIHTQSVTVFRMESSIYFATAEKFRNELYSFTGDPRKKENEQKSMSINDDKIDDDTDAKPLNNNLQNGTDQKLSSSMLKYVIIDCSSVNYMDMNGINTLIAIAKDYKKVDITVMLVKCTQYLLNIIQRSPLTETLTEDHIFPEISDAIHATRS